MLLPQMFNLWRSNKTYVNTILAGKIPFGGSSQDNALAAAAITAIRALGNQAAAPTCVGANQNLVESRHDVEFQDTFVFSDTLRMVNGIGARQDIGNSQTYLGGRVTNNSFRFFSNVEYKASKWLNMNAGGFLEKDQLTGAAFSPRVAMNFHMTDNHTLRFVVSKGTRMPDIHEQRANWTYSPSNPSQGIFFQSAKSPGNLSSEHILSKEIGYFGNLPQYGVLIDAKVFDDRLTGLISEKLQVSDFSPTNNNSVHLRGAELQVNYSPNDRWMAYLAYAYLHSRDASTALEQTQYSNHSGALGVTRLFNDGWRVSLAYYGSNASTAAQTFYGREDITLSKTSSLGKDSRLTTSFTIRHLDNVTTQYFQDFGKTMENRYNNTMQYTFAFKFTY